MKAGWSQNSKSILHAKEYAKEEEPILVIAT